jgi:hypothetical protein
MKLKNEDRLNDGFAYVIQHRTKATLIISKNGEWALSNNDCVFFFNSDKYVNSEDVKPACIIPIDGNAFVTEVCENIFKKLGE